ncbi:transposase [Amycolatopsis vastitatis]|uniref:transposase n=1 Tax=Amycolatopsis vastitatis TaxID=1905142 RepID=UPI0034DFB262
MTWWRCPRRSGHQSWPPGTPRKTCRTCALWPAPRPDRAVIWTRLSRFYERCGASGLPELERLAGTVSAWWPEILTFIDTGITNAGSEGTNRVIKTVACDAYNSGTRSVNDSVPAAQPPAKGEVSSTRITSMSQHEATRPYSVRCVTDRCRHARARVRHSRCHPLGDARLPGTTLRSTAPAHQHTTPRRPARTPRPPAGPGIGRTPAGARITSPAAPA